MISVIIPFYNEEENLPLLHKKLSDVLQKEGRPYELVFIDDGSTDRSVEKLPKEDSHVTLVQHRRKMGKGKGLVSGYNAAKGEIIVFMDADLQDDPDELPRFLAKIDEGYDLVNGWRKKRLDSPLMTIQSRIGNLLILRTMLQSQYHDINCGFKAFKREILDEIQLYGDNFRFFPVMAEKEGFHTTEIPIKHNQRKHGVSKFGLFKGFTIFVDILTTYFLFRFSEKPLHFFGTIGGISFGVGFLVSLYLTIERLFFNQLLYQRPVLLFAILLIIIGIQVFMTGIIAELIVFFHKKRST